jgi:hypothetical protein
LLLELFPGGAPKFLSSHKARAMIATIKPRDIVGKTRRRLAVELITELEAIDKKIKGVKLELRELIAARGSTLMELTGIGPSGAARLLVDVGDIHRFADRDKFASWNGTAPLDASSGDQKRHRLSRAGNRRISRALHIMAVVQLFDSHGCATWPPTPGACGLLPIWRSNIRSCAATSTREWRMIGGIDGTAPQTLPASSRHQAPPAP